MKNTFNQGKVSLVFTTLLMLTAGGLVFSIPSTPATTTTTLFTSAEQPVMAQTTNNGTVRVGAGGGNATAPLTVYFPQNITIEAGQAINWINPTTVGEPHSVTFLKENNLFPPFVVPFAVSSTTEFKALLPSPNVEPLVVPNPAGANNETEKTVIVNNGSV
jgi:plastocyanin